MSRLCRKRDSGSTPMRPPDSQPWLLIHALAPSLYDPELLATYALLLTILLSGVVAITWTYRWYRTLKHLPSSKEEDLDQLARALEEEDELAPEERERVRAALQRQRPSDGQAAPNPEAGGPLSS